MAADFNFTPKYPYKAKLAVSKALINQLEDLSEVRKSTGATVGGVYGESYLMSGTEMATLLSFFETYQTTTPFTKLKYDPMDASFDEEDPASASGPLETVRFNAPPSWAWSSIDEYKVDLKFKRLPNE